MKTRAMDHQVFYISSTGVNSMIAAPNAKILADCGDQDEAVAVAEADLATATLSPENFWEYIYSGIRDHRERHLKLRQAEAYRVLIREAYEKQKAEYLRGLRGEKQVYEWRWSEED